MAENRVTTLPAQVLHGGGQTRARVTTEYVQVLRSLDDSGDPFFSNVVLLCHFDGTDGQTTSTDSSNSAHTLVFDTGAELDNTRRRFGPTSLRTNGTAPGIVRIANDADFQFGNGEFTVEGFVNFNSAAPSNAALCGQWGGVTGQTTWFFFIAGGNLIFRFYNTTFTAVFDTSAAWAPAANTWYHVAATRTGNEFRIFVNGVMLAKVGYALPMGAGTGAFGIGNIPGQESAGFAANAWFDEWRITKGVSRYQSDAGFAPPSGPFPDQGAVVPIEIDPTAGQLEIEGFAPDIFNGNTIAPIPGELVITGFAPDVELAASVSPLPGALEIQGFAPDIDSTTEITTLPGALEIAGAAPTILSGIRITPEPGQLLITGNAPFIALNLEVRATQSAVMLLGEVVPAVRASQSAVLMLGEIVPDVKATQSAILVLVDAQPCVSRRCDVWVIERRDGERLAFTSHDLPVPFGDLTATPCGSLTPTAIEQASEISGVGNLELQGLITSSRISEADLYAGLYDDAFVEVWRVSWDPELPEPPIRMAAGWWGNLTHGNEGFSAEILGPGSRIQQQALVQMVTPGCRRDFGSPQGELPPGGCGVNRDAYKVTGGVALASNRARFVAVLDGPGTAPQYANGLVRWLSGPNVGTACEVKSVDFGTGEIILWVPTGFLPNEGDDFELLPGCDKLPETCKLYANYINFGGFPDVPGTDAISETPDAKL